MSDTDARRARVRELVELFHEDWKAWVDAIPDDLVVATDPDWPDGGVFSGRDDIRGFLATFVEAWSSVELVVGELTDAAGGSLISPAKWVVQGSTSGIDTTMEFSIVWLFGEDDELREARFFFNPPKAWEYAASQG